jgi:hypothetical protein
MTNGSRSCVRAERLGEARSSVGVSDWPTTPRTPEMLIFKLVLLAFRQDFTIAQD